MSNKTNSSHSIDSDSGIERDRIYKKSEIKARRRRREALLVWLILVLAVVFIIILTVFIRLTVGKDDSQRFDFFTTPFVPGESPHSTGPDSR